MSEDVRFREIEEGGELGEYASRLDRPVRIVLAAEEAGWAHQLTAICLVDLLARLLPRLQIDCDPELPAHPALPPGPKLMSERFAEARGNSLLDPLEASGEEPAVSVRVGRAAEADLYLEGAGWVSYLGQRPAEVIEADALNPIGPLLAAARGAAQVIGQLLGDLLPGPPAIESAYWSALALGPCSAAEAAAEPRLEEPRLQALLMGAGSIGGAAVYALARVPGLAGEFNLVDFDVLETDNSRKALLARRADIEAGVEKVEVAATELAALPDLDTPRLRGSLAQWVAERPAGQPLPLVLCAVDSIPARRELADHMALEVLNAACGDTHITVSGHRTDEGPCVYCLYIEDVLDQNATRARMIAREVGLPEAMVLELRLKEVPLTRLHLRAIEDGRHLPRGSLAIYLGRTLDQLFDERILYGEREIADEEGRRSALQLAFVPALAGFLLAAEALKRAGGEPFSAHRLGPGGPAIEYSESLLSAPVGMLTDPRRWPTSECLCRSRRRLALMRERYGQPAP